MEFLCKYLIFYDINILAWYWLIKVMNIERGIAMKWIEIITLRSPSNVDTEFVDELLKEVGKSDTPKNLVEIRIYHHSVVETDLSIHIHWRSESGSQHKSPLGLKLSYALRNLGLLNHSVWVETAGLEVPLSSGNSRTRDIPAPDTKDNAVQTGPKIAEKAGF
jgi:hypothetical protein